MSWRTAIVATMFGGIFLEAIVSPFTPLTERGLTWHARGSLWAMALAMQAAATALWFGAEQLRCRGAAGRRVAWVALLLVLAMGAWPLAISVTSGDWIRRQSYVLWLRSAIAVAVPAGCVACWLMAMASDSSAGRQSEKATDSRWTAFRIAVLGVAAACAVALAIVNVTRFPGLYPVAHLAASFTAAWLMVPLAAMSARAALGSLTPRLRDAMTLALGVAGVFTVAAGAVADRTTRVELLLKSQRSGPVLSMFPDRERQSPVIDALATMDAGSIVVRPGRTDRPSFSIPDDWNVVLFVVDALRADGLSSFRRQGDRLSGNLTPTVDRFAKQAFRFRNAYASGTVTRVSLPSMFRSMQPFEALGSRGTSLAARMSEAGRTSVAVVPSALGESWVPGLGELFDGFAAVSVYPNEDQNQQGGLIRQVLERVRGEAFFAWFHHFGVHDPGWAGERLDGASGVWAVKHPEQWETLYPKALRWMDAQFGRLLSDLEELGLDQKTVVVLAADHGEGLGDHGSYVHGGNVYDELSRVPLLIHIPGRAGHVIDETVGTIDLVPTLGELVKATGHASAGRSLLSLMASGSALWEPSTYYLDTGLGVHGVVRERLKYVEDDRKNLSLLFDLERDPQELKSVLDEGIPSHRLLIAEMVRINPAGFQKHLQRPAVASLLDERLDTIDTGHASRDLQMLLKLVALAPNPRRLAWGERLVREAAPAVSAEAMVQLYPIEEKRFIAALEGRLAALEPSQAALLADRLISGDVGPFALKYVIEQITSAAREGSLRFRPWLHLAARWRLPVARVAPAGLEVLAHAQHDADRRDALEWIASSSGRLKKEPRAFAKRVLQALAHPVPAVRAAAARAAGKLRDDGLADELRRCFQDPSILVRGAALRGLGAMLGADALRDVARVGRHPLLVTTAIDVVEAIGSPEGLGFLSWAKQNGASRVQVERAYRKLVERQQNGAVGQPGTRRE